MPEADPLGAVREAERLVREAQERAEAIAREQPAGGPPPSGWDVPHEQRSAGSPFPDLAALAGLLEAARGAVPPDLARQLADALRELLLALRALIDWYLERLGEPDAGRSDVEVEDIPLD
jgi:hypothetical protein